ncbi:YdgA family protein [Gilliamella sp. ESL0254]|uniref:YdgA family protein n=1 Tax=Gilliamella sp. ESL0254 TaxID=2705035 RepID=UPI001580D4FC|nr:DUF945 family protein [Gilliamella sp. ESL0254]NUF27157.1 YdgA family protein [Gilliamella sp. ESL0254]
MKKTTLAMGIVAVLGVSYVGTAWYTGNIIERDIDSQLALITNNINQIQDKFTFNIEKSNYDKGIFSTKLHLKVTSSQNQSFDEAATPQKLFDDDITIHHGPFPIAALAKGTFVPQMAWLEYEMTEQTNQRLWKLADNQPFISGHMGISYGEYVTAKLTSKAIKFMDNDFDIGKGYFTFSGYIDGTDMTANLQLDRLPFLSDDTYDFNVIFSDLNLSLTPLSTLDEVDYKLNIGNIKYSFSTYSIAGLDIDNIKSTGKFNYKTQDIDLQGSIDKMILESPPSLYTPNIKTLVFNNITMKQKSILNKASNIIDNSCFANIDSIIYGQQNLGNIQTDVEFQSLNRDWSRNLFDMNDMNLNDINLKQNIKFSLNKFNWHTPAGDINININLMLDVFDIYEMSLVQDPYENINAIKFKLEAPFDVLARISAQIENPNDNNVTPQQITKANQMIQLVANLLKSKSSFLMLSNGKTDGFYLDLNLAKDSDEVEVNGKTMSKEEFLDNL